MKKIGRTVGKTSTATLRSKGFRLYAILGGNLMIESNSPFVVNRSEASFLGDKYQYRYRRGIFTKVPSSISVDVFT